MDDKTEPVTLTADVVVFDTTGRVLLVQRKYEPFKGHWALPGGHVDSGETSRDAAVRELWEETGLRAASFELSLAFLADEPDRDPRGRYVSAVYSLYVVPGVEEHLKAGDDAEAVAFFPFDPDQDNGGLTLAFDHAEIIRQVLA
jgi:8-oxo-dGTP diphosphatase